METLLVFFFEKIIVYMPEKILTWPKFDHLLPKFLAKIDNLRVCDLLLSNAAMNHLYFWYWIFSYGVLWELYSICRKNSDMAKLWPFKQFLAKIDSFESFGLHLPNASMNPPIFWHGSCSTGLLWGKSYCIYQENSDMAKLWTFNKAKILQFLPKIDRFESFWSITSKHRYEAS